MEQFASFDGLPIAYEVVGSGPDVLLLHGFASSATGNWIQPGIRDALVATGRRVTCYDARGHGASGKPHDVAAYANDAMVRDAQALLTHLGIGSVDVVGYSMGAITSSRLVPVEPRSRSVVLGGIGGNLAADRGERRARIAAALERASDDPEGRAFRRFAERNGNDLEALAAVQKSAIERQPGRIRDIRIPALVVAGAEDLLAGSPDALAARIPGAVARVVPGNHLSAVGRPELTAAITEFLAAASPTSR